MNLLPRFRATSYLWPGLDSAGDVLGVTEKQELRSRIAAYFAELRAVYGREVVALAFAVFGNEATFEQADHIKRNLPALQQRARETPNLLPLFSLGLMFDRVSSDTGVFRTHATSQGLSAAGWRWLSRQERATVRHLARDGLTPPVIAWVNLLAQTGAPLPPWLAETGGPYYLRDLNDQVLGTLKQPDSFRRAEVLLVQALRFTLRSAQDVSLVGNRPLFVRQYEQLAVEVVRRLRTRKEAGFERSNWKKFAEELEREQREREIAIAQRLEALRLKALSDTQKLEEWKSQTWECAIPDCTISNIGVRALCNHYELVAEGTVMDHCLKDGTYLPMLLDGQARVFSLRGSVSTFRATLMIVRGSNGRWIISQLKTFANVSPPAIFHNVAKRICELYTKAASEQARAA